MKTVTPYKTAGELQIAQWEHDGLVALIGPLSQDYLQLDMESAGCGTCHCIGGWIAHFHCISPLTYVGVLERGAFSRSLLRLFYPIGDIDDDEDNGWHADAPQAARAIVNFLTLGDPKWDDVMRGQP